MKEIKEVLQLESIEELESQIKERRELGTKTPSFIHTCILMNEIIKIEQRVLEVKSKLNIKKTT
jgi:hypothetical protein